MKANLSRSVGKKINHSRITTCRSSAGERSETDHSSALMCGFKEESPCSREHVGVRAASDQPLKPRKWCWQIKIDRLCCLRVKYLSWKMHHMGCWQALHDRWGGRHVKNPSEISADVYFYHPLYFPPFFSSPADTEITALLVSAAASLSISVHLSDRLESSSPAGGAPRPMRRCLPPCQISVRHWVKQDSVTVVCTRHLSSRVCVCSCSNYIWGLYVFHWGIEDIFTGPHKLKGLFKTKRLFHS